MTRKLAEILGLLVFCALVVAVSIALVSGNGSVQAAAHAGLNSMQTAGQAWNQTP